MLRESIRFVQLIPPTVITSQEKLATGKILTQNCLFRGFGAPPTCGKRTPAWIFGGNYSNLSDILSEAFAPQIRSIYKSIWRHMLKYAYGFFSIKYWYSTSILWAPPKFGIIYGSIWGHIWVNLFNPYVKPKKTFWDRLPSKVPTKITYPKKK